MSYPNEPGYKEKGGTSQQAARSIQESAASVRAKVREVFRKKIYLTADQAADLLGLSVLTVRPRVSELFLRDDLSKTTIRRQNASGHTATVYAYNGDE